jgi:hypothetical protein
LLTNWEIARHVGVRPISSFFDDSGMIDDDEREGLGPRRAQMGARRRRVEDRACPDRRSDPGRGRLRATLGPQDVGANSQRGRPAGTSTTTCCNGYAPGSAPSLGLDQCPLDDGDLE